MSKFVEIEWFGRDHKIGIVLTYDEHDGFKCRMAPLPFFTSDERSEADDIEWLMREAAKVPFEWAWGIFGPRMCTEWVHRNLTAEDYSTIRYDGRMYNVETLEEVR